MRNSRGPPWRDRIPTDLPPTPTTTTATTTTTTTTTTTATTITTATQPRHISAPIATDHCSPTSSLTARPTAPSAALQGMDTTKTTKHSRQSLTASLTTSLMAIPGRTTPSPSLGSHKYNYQFNSLLYMTIC